MNTSKSSKFLAAAFGLATLLISTSTSAKQTQTEPSPVATIPLTAAIRAAHLAEPLVRTAPTTQAEDIALTQALMSYKNRKNPDDVSSLNGFLTRYPKSGWTPALQTDLGNYYLHDGYFSRAISAWHDAWEQGKNATDPHARAIVDNAVGQLAQLYASLGQFNNLAILSKEMGTRPITGSATEAVQYAADELTLVHKDPRHLFNCGPVALMLLIQAQYPQSQQGSSLIWYHAGPNGTNLAELGSLAKKAGFAYRLIFRKPGQPVPVPSVVNWKVGHFSAILGKANGRYDVVEPGWANTGLWVTQGALDSEASGYFLVPASTPTAAGWRAVSSVEASGVWGKGPTGGTTPGDAGDRGAHGGPPGIPPPKSPPGCPTPMCGYDIMESSVSLTLSDTPVGYNPPIGPSAKVQIRYNQREDSQPADFTFYNVSPKWTLNWLTYVTDDPTNPGGSVSRYLPGGGAFYYTGYNSSTGQFAVENDDGSILTLVSESPIKYSRLLPDGTVNIYSQSDGSTSYPRNIFLTQVIDPRGNTITLNYDSEDRLISLTDATGRQTSFSYDQPAQPLLVTKVTDPFGRSATFTYDSSGRLASITDILGITSSFTYDANSLVNSLTTPYGTTNFSYTAPGTSGPPRFVDVTDPLGYHEREEWVEPAPGISGSDPTDTVPHGMPVPLENEYLEYRDSFHWDKNQYIQAGCTVTGGCDYTKARDTHFAHLMDSDIKSTTVESIKYPLENRIWYNYPGQTIAYYSGTYNQPIAIGRVLDDGSTQLIQASYDTTGSYNLTQQIDPLGRTTSFVYGNQIDLAAVTQTTANGLRAYLDQYAYNNSHLPLIHVDAAAQITRYTYNTAGQITSDTNAMNQTNTYNYNSTGDLTSVINANGETAASYTYDAFDRIATYTDSEGWTVSFNYDADDRITKITYPDGTADIYTYKRLDLASYTDRLGRTWTYAYDADQRLTAMTDPTGHQTLYAYNPGGALTSLTDPNGNLTQWAYDLENRLITKTYPDSSTATYTYENTTSRLKSVEDALGQTKQYSYDEANELTGITYLDAVNPTPNVSFAYDTYFPRAVSMTDGTGTTQYSYVPPGSLGALQLQQEIPPLTSSTINYAFDALGRLSSRTVTGSSTEIFQYDALGRLTNDTNDLGAFTLAYLGQTDQITSRSLASSTLATTWIYLPNSGDRRLSEVSTDGLSSGQYSTFHFTTDAEGQITGMTQTSDATPSYPLTSQQTASFNNLNQITTLENPPPSSQDYTYDADGNLLSDGTHDYTWDAENRLVGITYPAHSGQATVFVYDGLGRRVTISETPAGGGSAVATSYIWCRSQPCQARNSSNAVIRAYYTEGEYVPGSPATPYYYSTDNLGSVRRVFYSSGAPSYDYDPYGNALQTTAPVTDYGYAGMFSHQASGLYLTMFRAYDPYSGRWLSRDPAGELIGGINLYGYVGEAPVYITDRLGLGPYGGEAQGQNYLQNPPPPLPCNDLKMGAIAAAAGGSTLNLMGGITPGVPGLLMKMGGYGLQMGGAGAGAAAQAGDCTPPPCSK